MPQSFLQNLPDQLQLCLTLAQDMSAVAEANRAFEKVLSSVAAENPATALLLTAMWKEVLTARQAARFWQTSCQTERAITERLASEHFQLHQNYQRLMQEL